MILKRVVYYQQPDDDSPPREAGWRFWCPGCEESHQFTTDTDRPVHWDFDRNLEKPTFDPSLGVYDMDDYPNSYQCHLFMTDGMIQFLGDCKHELAGQTVPVVPLPEDEQ